MNNNKEPVYGFVSKVCFTIGIVLALLMLTDSVVAGLAVLSFFAIFGFAFVKNDKLKKIKVIGSIIGMVVFVGAYGGNNQATRNTSQNVAPTQAVASTSKSQPQQLRPSFIYPENQRWLSKVVNHYKHKYQQQPNELAKTDMRFQRAKFIEDSGITGFKDWYLKIDRISTVMGKAHMRMAYDNVLLTFEVEPGSSQWNSIKTLNEGAIVKVSGVFDKNMFDKDDYFFETSLTELGSMEQPNYMVKLSHIEQFK